MTRRTASDARRAVARGRRDLASTVKSRIPLGWRKRAKVWRALSTEALGSDRYSAPALNGLDRKVLPLLPARGVFLEIGANDGYAQSNTYLLERRGWRGILIEPSPTLHARCRRLRRNSYCVNTACVARNHPSSTVVLADRDLMSVTLGVHDEREEVRRAAGAARFVEVAATTLSRVIDESPFEAVDFMSVDVEGAELAVLDGLDLDRHCPSWLLIETALVSAVAALCRPHLELHEQLTHHDYLFRRVASAAQPHEAPGHHPIG